MIFIYFEVLVNTLIIIHNDLFLFQTQMIDKIVECRIELEPEHSFEQTISSGEQEKQQSNKARDSSSSSSSSSC